jgi:hypothetical protein
VGLQSIGFSTIDPNLEISRVLYNLGLLQKQYPFNSKPVCRLRIFSLGIDISNRVAKFSIKKREQKICMNMLT